VTAVEVTKSASDFVRFLLTASGAVVLTAIGVPPSALGAETLGVVVKRGGSYRKLYRCISIVDAAPFPITPTHYELCPPPMAVRRPS